MKHDLRNQCALIVGCWIIGIVLAVGRVVADKAIWTVLLVFMMVIVVIFWHPPTS